MDEDLWLIDPDLLDALILFDLLAGDFFPEVPREGGGKRKPPMAGAPHIVERQRTEEVKEQLRLLKLLNQANDAKSLKRWQAEENENARQKHNKLLFGRLGREADTKKIRGAPDVKRANREIAKRDDEAERQRQERIYNQRLANLEKGRKKH